jgi:GNAT superfamily N-acetyltransferase
VGVMWILLPLCGWAYCWHLILGSRQSQSTRRSHGRDSVGMEKKCSSIFIREVNLETDRGGLWEILCPIIRQGETYAFPRDWDEETAIQYWCHPSHRVHVAIIEEKILGTYFIHENQKGGGSHVCNCGYATHQSNMSHGIGYEMCLHSLELGRSLGYSAMQYNFVISTNERAVKLWQRCGFDIVGTLPGAFESPSSGLVDVFVMFQRL